MKRLILLTIIFFVALGVYVINLPPREMTLKDLHPAYIPHPVQNEPTPIDTSRVDDARVVVAESAIDRMKSDSIAKSEAKTKLISDKNSYSPLSSGAKTSTSSDSASTVSPSANVKSRENEAIDFFIIVGSLRSLEAAQKRVEFLRTKYKVDFYILPPTSEGYFRISFGKYPTFDEAQSTLIIARMIMSDAWIFSAASSVQLSRK